LKVFKNTFPAPEKYLYTLFRRRRSAYIHIYAVYSKCYPLKSSQDHVFDNRGFDIHNIQHNL